MLPLLQIKNLQIDFLTETGNNTAVKDITLTVNRNEVVGIAGESGSGKSVTSLAILQLLSAPPAKYVRGEIIFSPDGITAIDLLQLKGDALRAIRGKEIGMIFQEPMSSLNPLFTCGNQVMEAIRLHQQLTLAEAKKRTIALFEKVKLPDPVNIFHRFPHQLSGGQKQRVMIAMAMSGNPSLLICDEPTTALDVTVQKAVLELIKELQSTTGIGVILITHDLGVIAETANRVVVMYQGTIAEQGQTEQVFHHPSHPYTRGLLACRPSLYPKGTRLPVVSDFLAQHNTEKTIGTTTPSSTTENLQPEITINTSPLIRVEQLSVHFSSGKSFLRKSGPVVKAVDNVSFSIYKGETLGLVGESGCGKTTLGRTLLRLTAPTAGKIYFEDKDLFSCSAGELKTLRRNMQLIFQDPYSSLNPSITIGDAIAEPLQVHEKQWNARQRKERVTHLLTKVHLQADHYHRYPHEFSGGQRQRIVIARALILHPSFIVCDESVSALDVSVQAQILNLLNDLKKEFDFTCVFISHDLSVVRYISDRIMVMKDGAIIESGASEDIYLRPAQTYTRKLIKAVPVVPKITL